MKDENSLIAILVKEIFGHVSGLENCPDELILTDVILGDFQEISFPSGDKSL
jgi:hypothetical protein